MVIDSFFWFDKTLIFWIVLTVMLNTLLIFAWEKKLYLYLGMTKYRGIQRIHNNETPRFGGIVFIIGVLGFALNSPASEAINLLKQILFFLLPTLFISFKEDLFHNVEPISRLIMLLFSAWLFRAFYQGPLPNLDTIFLVNKLTTMPGGLFFLLILGMVSISNGMNLIDGVNGLCVAASLSSLLSLLFLAYRVGDTAIIAIILILILFLIPFIFFNYPYGKIFLGDLGAYSLGMLISMLTIILFGKHSQLSPWAALIVVIYPALEVSFSFMRRLLKGGSTFLPDTEHLHLKLFYFFKSKSQYKNIANPLVSVYLSFFWVYPLITIFWIYEDPYLIKIALFFFIISYLCAIFFISSLDQRHLKD
jgi:UDP-GlcNAc:undecaprenyl-phosphate GlcNAc-1-phosphate transferase